MYLFLAWIGYRYCLDCKHCIPNRVNYDYSRCALFKAPVNDTEHLYCSTARRTWYLCNEYGLYYEKKGGDLVPVYIQIE